MPALEGSFLPDWTNPPYCCVTSNEEEKAPGVTHAAPEPRLRGVSEFARSRHVRILTAAALPLGVEPSRRRG